MRSTVCLILYIVECRLEKFNSPSGGLIAGSERSKISCPHQAGDGIERVKLSNDAFSESRSDRSPEVSYEALTVGKLKGDKSCFCFIL
jgi:hypothetical protein